MVAWQVKPLCAMPAAHIRVVIREPATLLPIQFPANVPGKAAEDGPKYLGFCIHMGAPDGVPTPDFGLI